MRAPEGVCAAAAAAPTPAAAPITPAADESDVSTIAAAPLSTDALQVLVREGASCFVNAIMAMPRTMRTMYLHAYQVGSLLDR